MQESDGSGSGSGSGSHEIDDHHKSKLSSSSDSIESSLPRQDVVSSKNKLTQSANRVVAVANEPTKIVQDTTTEISLVPRKTVHGPPSSMQKSTTISNGPANNARPKTVWGRTSVSICIIYMLFHTNLVFWMLAVVIVYLSLFFEAVLCLGL